jgi:nucleoid-associated protein YgaU
VDWTISKTEMTPEGQDLARAGRDRALSDVLSVMSSALPEGKSKKDMKSATSQSQESDGHSNVQWKPADSRITGLRREAKESGEAYEARKKSWKADQRGSWEEPVTS